MLDVHPPHAPTHTWREFLLHIATIVVGLLIAIGLEQAVEAIHHHHERHQLREDLRAEAELRVQRLVSNQRLDAEDNVFYEQVLRAGREGVISGGFVTFTMPGHQKSGYIATTPNGVLSAARASGALAVLSRSEIELWDEVDSFNEVVQKSFDNRQHALRDFFAVSKRTGVSVNPGPVRLSVEDRDEMMHALAELEEATWQLERDSALWQGACEGALHGAATVGELSQYEDHSVRAMPQ